MDADEVIVDVAEVDAVVVGDRGVGVTGETVQDLAFGANHPVQLQGGALDSKDRLECAGGRRVEDLFLGRVDREVQRLNRRQELGDGQVEEMVQQMIDPVSQPVRGVALDVAAILLQEAERLGVVRDQIVFAEKDVEFVQLDVAAASVVFERVEDEVKVIAPVIDFGDVGLFQGVFNGQRVELEDVAKQRLGDIAGTGLGVVDINPDTSLAVVQGRADLINGPVQMDQSGRVPVNHPNTATGKAVRRARGFRLLVGFGVEQGHGVFPCRTSSAWRSIVNPAVGPGGIERTIGVLRGSKTRR